MRSNKKSIDEFDGTVVEYNKEIHKWAIDQNKSQQELLNADCFMDACVSKDLPDGLYIKNVIANMDSENFPNMSLTTSVSYSTGYFKKAFEIASWGAKEGGIILLMVWGFAVYGPVAGPPMAILLCTIDHYFFNSISGCLTALGIVGIIVINNNQKIAELMTYNSNILQELVDKENVIEQQYERLEALLRWGGKMLGILYENNKLPTELMSQVFGDDDAKTNPIVSTYDSNSFMKVETSHDASIIGDIYEQ